MREIEFFHYRPGTGYWHRHDARLKLFELAAWSVMALRGGPTVLGATALVLVILHAASGSRLRRLARPLLFWAAMAAAIVTAAGLSDAGTPVVVAGRPWPIGRDGLLAGALRAARLLAVLLAGQLLAATTDPADIAAAIRRLTRFLPATWSAALGTAVSLTLAFIPRIMDEGATVRDAAFSRGLGLRRSLFRRAVTLGLPLAEATLRRADLTAEALLSRGYVTDPTPPEMRLHTEDGMMISAALLPPLLVWICL